jgi:hypothetical protein
MGIALVGVVSGRSPIRGIISALIGMLLGLVGVSLVVGGERFTMGILPLYDGIPLTATLIGLFAIPELVQLLRANETISQVGYAVKGGVFEGVKAVLTRPVLLIRSSLIGSFIGMVPGPGGSVASWMAYYTAQRISKHPETFGRGNVEGVIAPEASIDAKEGGSLVPIFILGLPGSVTGALLVAAFQFHGVLPGATLFRDEAPLIWVMIFGMVAANLLTSITGLALSNVFVRITLIPAVLIAPVVLALGFTGAYADGTAMFGVLIVLVAGVAGLALERLGYPRPPLLIGMILIPLAESNFHQALQLSRGSYDFLLRPLTLAIFALALIGILGPAMYRRMRHTRRAEAPAFEVERVIEEATPPVPTYARPEILFLGCVVLVLVAMLVGVSQVQPRAMIFPLVVIVPTAFLVIARLVFLVRGPLRQPSVPITPEDDGVKRPYWQILAWITALPILIWLLGVKIAIAIYIPVFMIFFDKDARTPLRIAIALLLTAGIVLLLYLTFEQFLGVNFPPGVLGR